MIEQDFYDQLKVSIVGTAYLTLISEKKCRALIPEKGYEIHHIYPTSLGGTDTNQNKVKLTVFEHCQAHSLLAQAITCYKTLQPLTRMSYGQVKKLSDLEQHILNGDLYKWSELREKALHHPKSKELIEKNRQGHLGKKLSKEHVAKRTARRVGTITVTDGTATKYITPGELGEWESKGWYKGIGSVRREKLKSSHTGKKGKLSVSTGRKCINKGGKELKVKVEDVKKYLSEGWSLGRDKSFIVKRSKAMKGKTNIGKVRINKDGIGKLVSKSDLQKYLDEGWKKGRLFRQTCVSK